MKDAYMTRRDFAEYPGVFVKAVEAWERPIEYY